MKFILQVTCVLIVFLLQTPTWAEDSQNNNQDHNTISSAQQITKANPDGIYWDRTPDVLFAIPIFKVTVGADGFIENIIVLRKPINPDAIDTIDLAISAMKKVQPFKSLITNGESVEFVQTFLFRDDRRFKLRVLDEAQNFK